MKRKKGFTLVELLATLVLLALLAIVVTPMVTRTINNNRLRTFELSIEGLMDVVRNHSAKTNYVFPSEYRLNNNVLTLHSKLGTAVTPPEVIPFDGNLETASGSIGFDKCGNVCLVINDPRFCASRRADGELVVTKSNEDGICPTPVCNFTNTNNAC